jgi:hypothetical protein
MDLPTDHVPADLLLATLGAYKFTRNLPGRRDVIAACALQHIFSDVYSSKVVLAQISVTPNSKARRHKDWTRYATLLNGVWLLDPVLDDLNDPNDRFLPEVMIVPMKPGARASYSKFRWGRMLYGLCSDKWPSDLAESASSCWMPVAQAIHDGMIPEGSNKRF